MDKPIVRMAALLLTLGLLGVGGTGYWAWSIRDFVLRAEAAPGQVIRLERSGGRHRSVHPVVRFRLPSGEERTFRARSGSSPGRYAVGEGVEVLYDPGDPSDCRIGSGVALWQGPGLLSLLSVTFTAVGATMLLLRRARARRADELRRRGRRIVARLLGVERNTHLRIQGRSPWRIVAEWHDPRTGLPHRCRSENLWIDPTPYLGGQEVTLFIDPADPERCAFDLSFIPRSAA